MLRKISAENAMVPIITIVDRDRPPYKVESESGCVEVGVGWGTPVGGGTKALAT